jgi:hypothetical protein
VALRRSGAQALRIIDPISGDAYYVEYRTDSGLDATSAEFNYRPQCDPAMSGYTICELDSDKATGDVRILRFIPFASLGAHGTTVMATGLTAGSTDKTKRHTHLDSDDSFTSVDDGGFDERAHDDADHDIRRNRIGPHLPGHHAGSRAIASASVAREHHKLPGEVSGSGPEIPVGASPGLLLARLVDQPQDGLQLQLLDANDDGRAKVVRCFLLAGRAHLFRQGEPDQVLL